ncbi:MAG: serine protease [Proteobacteria bacterium]|nr:serine protease [Verrucomicrobiota bacterium]NBU11088.1 serine protease [Pseudomonadota bacterium]NDF00698.1 serine protease [Verrucomicrobiota bacterium]
MRNLLFAALALATASSVTAQGQQYVQRLYTEFGWETSTPLRRLAFKRETRTGSFWIASVNGEKHIVTAGHNLGLMNGRLAIAPQDASKVFGTYAETLLGRYAYGVSSVGLPNSKADWVALKPEHPSVLERSRAFTLAEKSPEIGDRVQVWGFAGQPHPKNLSFTVVDVSEGKDFLTLNDRLPPGYSGGVVLNEKGEAVAVAVATKAEHSSALILNPAAFKALTWKPIQQIHGTANIPAEDQQAFQQLLDKYDRDTNGYLDDDERERMPPDDRDKLKRLEQRLPRPLS